ncbi:MAG: CPBP family intramembrane metalloprotease [Planctomycetaceae bacterium]|nr:CPBP family intramembrane metalloprotease [Planctomycetaceae bacterium]
MTQVAAPEPTCHCCHCRVCRAEQAAREKKTEQPKPEPDYWLLARRPLACLLFLFPLLAVYEAGVIWMGGEHADQVRNGADAWMRNLFQSAGVSFGFVVPIVVVVILVAWHLKARHSWKVSGETLMGMFAESILFAFLLIVAGQLQNLAFEKLGNPEVPLSVRGSGEAGPLIDNPTTALAISYVGAGIYEEALFRLCLLPMCFGVFRVLQLNKTWAAVLSVLATSLLFSVAHHVGSSGEAFRLFPFTFRLVAGLFFAGLFLIRGFGITVGTHAIYDLLVGLLLTPTP